MFKSNTKEWSQSFPHNETYRLLTYFRDVFLYRYRIGIGKTNHEKNRIVSGGKKIRTSSINCKLMLSIGSEEHKLIPLYKTA